MSPERKREYETNIPIILAIGIALLILGILSLIPPITMWLQNIGKWFATLLSLSIFGGIILIVISIGLYYQNTRLQQKVIKSVVSGDYGSKVSLDEISADFGLNSGDMRRLLTDLRIAGELKVSFDSRTGEVIFPTIGGYAFQETSNGSMYCSYCGLQLSKDSGYCPSCGANLH
ncbi:MAG: zinc ribbon domain-containing protein [Promethearchaeota archaeon]